MGTKRPSLDDLRLRMNESTARKNEHLFNNGGKEKTGDRVADKTTDLESNPCDESMAAEKTPRFDSPIRIHFHQRRHKLTDPDGASSKAALDGLVKAGVCRDDSAKEIKEVTHSQEKIPKSETEKTIITIEEV